MNASAAMASAPAPRPRGLWWAHWQGELPLAGSFWWRFALPVALLAPLLDGLALWMSLQGGALQPAATALLLGWPLLLLLAVWGGVGAWRAAARAARRGAAPLWVGGARAAVVAAALGLLAIAGLGALPQAGAWLDLARGIDPLGRLEVQRSADGRRLRLQGPLAQGSAAQLRLALQAAPKAYLVELDSPGGRAAEAHGIAAALRARQLQTRVVGRCANACVMLFMAGRGREVLPAGQLGLQRLSSGTALPLFDRLARPWQAAALRDMGLPEPVVDRALRSSPQQLWVLAPDELTTARLTGIPGRPLDIHLPPADAALADHAEALAAQPAWRALEAYRPGSLDAAAAALQQARAQGAEGAAAQVAAQRVLEALLPALVRDAGPALREQYVEILLGQLQAAQALGPAACRQVLAGDAAARYALPAPWPEREAAWLLQAAAEPVPAPPRPLNELESEVLRRTLGEQAAAVLGAIRQPARGDARPEDCERAAGLLADVLRLSAPERRLALRLLFGRSA